MSDVVPFVKPLAPSAEHKYEVLKEQLRRLEAAEMEAARKKLLNEDIADLREKIREKGEEPCA